MSKISNIKRRPDGSYEITYAGLPYHTYPGHRLFAAVDAYATEHPDEVTILTPTPPAPPTQAQRIAALNAEYRPQFDRLIHDMGAAIAAGYGDVEAEIKAEYQSLLAEFNQKMGEIVNDQ
jgi:hypothetical protein